MAQDPYERKRVADLAAQRQREAIGERDVMIKGGKVLLWALQRVADGPGRCLAWETGGQ